MEAVTHGQDCINNQSFHPNTLSIHVSSIDCSLYTMQVCAGNKKRTKSSIKSTSAIQEEHQGPTKMVSSNYIVVIVITFLLALVALVSVSSSLPIADLIVIVIEK